MIYVYIYFIVGCCFGLFTTWFVGPAYFDTKSEYSFGIFVYQVLAMFVYAIIWPVDLLWFIGLVIFEIRGRMS